MIQTLYDPFNLLLYIFIMNMQCKQLTYYVSLVQKNNASILFCVIYLKSSIMYHIYKANKIYHLSKLYQLIQKKYKIMLH